MRFLKTLIRKDVGLELNTAGYKYGLGHPNPTEAILKRYMELGGEILTIGCDGHAPEQLAWDFEKIPALLKECGFRYYTVFEERDARFLSGGNLLKEKALQTAACGLTF
ncbi:MAG: hypothetical protein ACLR2E_17080 [Lachnospiraceae bacterium]